MEILKVLVGSRAHNLDRPDSDYDYRGVFIVPTINFLVLEPSVQETRWVEGEDSDDTSWEIGKFLKLATHSNPSILEVFVSPVINQTPEGQKLRAMFPHVWSSKGVFEAFTGYARNQRKKFFKDKGDRPWKYALAQIRVLRMGIELLSTGRMSVRIGEGDDEYDDFIAVRDGKMTKGQVVDWMETLKDTLRRAYEGNPDKETNFERVNTYLLGVRKRYWDWERRDLL